MWDPYQKQNVERIEKVQRQAARFIKKDYKSRSPGCVSNMLRDMNLHPLEERRRHIRLGLLYKITEGLIPALPPQDFLTPANSGRRKIKPTRYEDHATTNIMERQATKNSRGFQIPACRTEQYRNSFFVKTALEWNHLCEATVTAGSARAFTAALSRSTPEPASTL